VCRAAVILFLVDFADAQVEVGTYMGRIGADPLKHENANAIRLEYQLSRRWAVDAEYGDARAGGADLVWTKTY